MGRVAFDFKADVTKLTKGLIEVSPLHGKLAAGDKISIHVKLFSKLPTEFLETFSLTCAYFDPVDVSVSAMGVFPQMCLTLPRSDNAEWEEYVEQVRVNTALREAAEEAEAEISASEFESNLLTVPGMDRMGASSVLSNVSSVGSRLQSLTGTPMPDLPNGMTPLPRPDTHRSTMSVLSNKTTAIQYNPVRIPSALSKINPEASAHMEADRLQFLDGSRAELNRLAVLQAAREAKAAALAASGVERSASTLAATSSNKKKAPFTISTYDCDFGHIVLGAQKEKTFKLTNTGGLSLSVDFNKRLFHASPFMVEPKCVVRLPPGESVNFTVSCITNPKKHKEQFYEVKLPLVVRNGPSVNVVLTANVVVPDLTLSAHRLEFGTVFKGYRKEMIVQLVNTKEVPVDWSLKAIQGAMSRDVVHFDCSPTAGTLHVGGRVNLVVAFTPQETCKVSVKIPIRLGMNPRGYQIGAKAEGKVTKMHFEPPYAFLGPCMPYLPSMPEVVTLCNDSNCEIEIYSLDFDQQYVEDDEILRGDENFVDNVLRAEPRLPGAPLPDDILSRNRRRKKMAIKLEERRIRKEAEAEAAAEAAALAATEAVEAAAANPDAVADAEAKQEEDEVGSLVSPRRPETAMGDVVDDEVDARSESSLGLSVRNVLVDGPPLSGKTQLCESIAERFGLNGCVVELDESVQFLYDFARNCDKAAVREVEMASLEAALASGKGNNKKDKERFDDLSAEHEQWTNMGGKEQEPAEVLDLAQRVRSTIQNARVRELELLSAREAEAEAAAKAAGKKASARGKSPGRDKKKKGGPTKTEDDYTGFGDLKGVDVFSNDTLEEIIKFFLLQDGTQRFGEGIVIDSLNCSFGDRQTMAKVLKGVFSTLRTWRDNELHVICLDASEATLILRARGMKQQCVETLEDKDLAAAIKKFKPVALKDQEKLAGDKLTQYLASLDQYNRYKDAEALLQRLDGEVLPNLANWFLPPAAPAPTPAFEEAIQAGSGDAGDASESTSFGESTNSTSLPTVVPALNLADTLEKKQDTVDVGDVALEEEDAEAEKYDPLLSIFSIFDILPPNDLRTAVSFPAEQQAVAEGDAALEELDSKRGKKTGKKAPEKKKKSSDKKGKKGEPDPEEEAARLAEEEAEAAKKALEQALADLIVDASVGEFDIELLQSPHNWVKGRIFNTRSEQQPQQVRIEQYIREEFYIPVNPADADPSYVPPPVLYQLCPMPKDRTRFPRANVGQVSEFVFVDKVEVWETPEPLPTDRLVEEKKKKDSKKKKTPRAGSKKNSPRKGEEEPPAPPPVLVTKYVKSNAGRWVIPPKGNKNLLVQFSSPEVGRYQQTLSFQILGSNKVYTFSPSGLAGVPEIGMDPRSVFMRRVKTKKSPLVFHQYITSDKVFDFGPLLCGKEPMSRFDGPTDEEMKRQKKKDPSKCITAVRKMNGETFRISNTGKFPLKVDFAFRDQTTSVIPEVEEDPQSARGKGKTPRKDKKKKNSDKKKKDSKKKGKKGEEEDEREPPSPDQPVFIVEPSTLELPVDEMSTITVWSFPQSVASFKDTLICCVKDNPTPVQFPVQCQGARPVLNIAVEEIEFDRLLIGSSEQKKLELVNPSAVPVHFTLTGLENCGEEFTFSITEGVIAPLSSTFMSFTFRGIEQKKYDIPLTFEVRDVEGILDLVDSRPLQLKAEAFAMTCKVEVPDNGLDFGVLRVGEQGEQSIAIANEGKYNVKFQFKTHRHSEKLFSQIFKIEPSEGDLAPGEELQVWITAQTTQEEDVANSHLRLQLVEGESGSVVQTLPVAVALRSSFSKYRILPVHGPSFGALEHNTLQTKTMKICNDGEFDFEFRLFPEAQRNDPEYAEPLTLIEELDISHREVGKKGKGKKGSARGKKKDSKKKDKDKKKSARGKDGKKKKGEEDGLRLGPFFITPVAGLIERGTTQEITVTMESKECEAFKEILECDISDRNLNYRGAGGLENRFNRILLDVTGETCSPGIETTAWESIFEEQQVRPRLAGNTVDVNHFAQEEKAFVYAPVIASQKGGVQTERFRIANPFKVPCNVALSCLAGSLAERLGSITPRATGGKTPKGSKKKEKAKKSARGKGAEEELNPFTVEPSALHIPSHEHRYITVSFRPSELKSYRGVFEAIVDKGIDDKTNCMRFELRGEGTLPHLTVVEPSALDESGACPVLQFPRVFSDRSLNKSATLPVVLKNEGKLPATCRFDMSNRNGFYFSGFGRMVTLAPGSTEKFEATFAPSTPGEHVCDLKMSVMQNDYEVTTFQLRGQGFLEDITLERDADDAAHDVLLTSPEDKDADAPADPEAEEDVPLLFGDVSVGATCSKKLTLTNHSNEPYKFTWDKFVYTPPSEKDKKGKKTPRKKGEPVDDDLPSDFTFSPSLGHLQPHTSKTVTVTFNTSAAKKIENASVRCNLQRIRYLTFAERVIAARERLEGGGKKDKKKSSEKKGKKSKEAKVEEEEEVDTFEDAAALGVARYDTPDDWDDTMTQSKWVTEAEIKAAEEAKANEGKKKKKGDKSPKAKKGEEKVEEKVDEEEKMIEIMEVIPEPEFEVVVEEGAEKGKKGAKKDAKRPTTPKKSAKGRPGSKHGRQTPDMTPRANIPNHTTDVGVRVSVTADRSVYECSAPSTMQFRETMMFQTRKFTFPIKNTSTINLDYSWNIKALLRGPAVVRSRQASRLGGRPPAEKAEQKEPGPLESTLDQPFVIEPSVGSILPGVEQVFSIAFSPLDARAFECLLAVDMPTLSEEQQPPAFRLRGHGQRPTCHFDITGSDYISAQRREAGLPGPGGEFGPLDPATNVIEFKSLGTRVRNTRRFFVFNPTNVSYNFQWKCEDLLSDQPAFRCATPKGVVEMGRKYEMAFEFTPLQEGIVESFWRFEIPAQNISMPVLLVGKVAEPEVMLDRTHVNFDAVMLGRRTTETVYLINTEHIPFSWSVDKNTFLAGSTDKPILAITPNKGVVMPNGKVALELAFRPSREEAFNFNVALNVKKKNWPLTLNIKGQGYNMASTLHVQQDLSVSTQRELLPGGRNRVDFGVVTVQERRTQKLYLTNTGSLNFNYVWNMPENKYVSLSPMSGIVRAGSKGEFELTFLTNKETNVDNLLASLHIANSKQAAYVVQISGRGKRPGLDFSFTKHDFGKCFLHPLGGEGTGADKGQGMVSPRSVLGANVDEYQPVTQVLRLMSNERTENISVDIISPNAPYLTVQGTSTVLSPGETLDVPITFVPTEVRKYHDVIVFEVNGLTRINVVITGEGTPLQIDLVEPTQPSLSFGNVREGHTVVKTIKLMNRSRKMAVMKVVGPVLRQTSNGKQLDDATLAETEEKLRKALSFYPRLGADVWLKPREVYQVDVKFAPSDRMPSFAAELQLQTMGIKQQLCVLSGACHGIAMQLNTDTLPFGTIIRNSSVTKRVKVSNAGDVGASFTWDANSLSPHFSVSPREGYIPPQASVNVDFTFKPLFLSSDIKIQDVACFVDGQTSDGMFLTLSGACVDQDTKDVPELRFVGRVRSTGSQVVTVKNDSTSKWELRPTIDNDLWRGDSTFVLQPGEEGKYEVKYTPLVMTREPPADMQMDTDRKKKGKSPRKPTTPKKKPTTPKKGKAAVAAVVEVEKPTYDRPAQHSGNMFIPLPNGNALSWKLSGWTVPAEPVQEVDVAVKLKQSHTQTLSVKNWLNSYQRFKVTIDQGPNSTAQVTGADTLDVPALLDRKFKLGFYAFTPGATPVKVTFLNEVSGESLVYIINFTASTLEAANVMRPFEAPVRQEVTQELVINNPKDTACVFSSFKCDNPAIFVPLPVTIEAKSKGVISIRYRPLHVYDDVPTTITLESDILGQFMHNVTLRSLKPASENALRYHCGLGSAQTRTFHFTSYAPKNTDFECKIGSKEFSLSAPKVSAQAIAPGAAGQELSVDVSYEPSSIGLVQDMLTVRSTDGGEFTCMLEGECSPPVPQGPIDLKQNGSASVSFKNVMDVLETFTFATDNPAFTVSKKTEKIKEKSTMTISVSFKPSSDQAAAAVAAKKPVNGKLLITCPAVEHASWVYYLQGSVSDGGRPSSSSRKKKK